MALTEEVIRFNYDRAMEKAGAVEAQASNLENSVVEEMGSVVVALRRDWEGESATEYIAKCNAMKGNIEQIASEMRSTASSIRTMAKNVYDAEMRALEIARQLAAANAAKN